MKNYKVDIKVRKNRSLLIWLTVVLTILLVAAIGVFVFLSLNAKYHFACVYECNQHESPVVGEQLSPPTVKASVTAAENATVACLETSRPEIQKSELEPTQEEPTRTETHKTTVVIKIDHDAIIRSRTPLTPTTSNFADRSTTSVVAKTRSNVKKSTSAYRVTPANLPTTRKPRTSLKGYITISGKISFKGKTPRRFPRNSRLIVEFMEDRFADAPSKLHGRVLVDLSGYRRGKLLSYTITCKRPELAHDFYSVSAVLNSAWRPKKRGDWIRKGDFFTDTYFNVHVNKNKRFYDRNIQLVKYTR